MMRFLTHFKQFSMEVLRGKPLFDQGFTQTVAKPSWAAEPNITFLPVGHYGAQLIGDSAVIFDDNGCIYLNSILNVA